MNTRLKKILVAVITPIAFVSFAGAATITLDTANAAFINQASNPNLGDLTAAAVVLNGGIAANYNSAFATTLYKNSSGSEEGTLKDFYSTGYTIGLNGGDATITWNGGGTFAVATYLLAKDGNLGSYLWDISDWNGTDTIFIPNPWLADQGTLKTYSHVQFWGSSDTTKVPDGGTTAVLLGLGLVGLSFAARRRLA